MKSKAVSLEHLGELCSYIDNLSLTFDERQISVV